MCVDGVCSVLPKINCDELPIRLFAEASRNGNNQRPDIFPRNPRGFGRQIILDVAVTGLDVHTVTL